MYWLRTLGGAALEHDGQPHDRIGALRKTLALLAIVAAERQISRDRLAVLLWPESDTEHARASLKQALHVLRRELNAPDIIEGTSELRINPAVLGSDVAQFRSLLEQGRWAEATELYRGPFLDGMHLSDSVEFDEWVERTRASLLERYREGMTTLAEQAQRAGDHAQHILWRRRLAATDPLRPVFAANLMRALDDSGDRAGALAHARVYETLVREELGAEPDAAVTGLAARLRAAPPHAPVVNRSAPADPPAGAVAEPPSLPRRRHGVAAAIGALAIVLIVTAVIALRPDASGRDPQRNSIAVLPFVDMSDERDRGFFSDGLTEELIATLSRNPALRVAARTSAWRFRDRAVDVREVGEQLGVSTILEGSVRTTPDRLRVTAQLIDAETGYHIWSETYDRRPDDLLAVQQEISRAIARALQVRMAGEWAQPRAPSNPQAYEEYLKGRFFANQRSEAGLVRGAEHFRRAIALDPNLARAYAGLADTEISPRSGPPGPRFRLARTAALRALAIDSLDAEAHTSMGWIALLYDREYEAARAHFQRALQINPSLAWAWSWYSGYLVTIDRREEALSAMQRARELDPLSAPITTHVGSQYFWLRRPDDAATWFRRALELDSTFFMAHWGLARVYAQAGRYDEALAELRYQGTDYVGFARAGLLGYTLARAGRRAEAVVLLRELEAQARAGRYVNSIDLAAIHIGLNDHTRALQALEQAAAEPGTRFFLLADPMYDPLRGDPRFQAILRRLRLTT